MMFEQPFEQMSPDELRLADIILFSEYLRTGNYEAEVERVAEIRMERMQSDVHSGVAVSE